MEWWKSLIKNIVGKLSTLFKKKEAMQPQPQYPRLLNYFKKSSDQELVKYIIKANVIKDRNGKIQIQVLTVDGWEFLEPSFLSELQSLLGTNCIETGLDDVGDLVYEFQDSLNTYLDKVTKTFTAAVKKNKF